MAKPPRDAYDANGPKAPGKPRSGGPEGFVDVVAGGDWVPNPAGKGSAHGWLDTSGRIWCPTGQGPLAHGGPHWDVQFPDGGYKNVRRGEHIDSVELKH